MPTIFMLLLGPLVLAVILYIYKRPRNLPPGPRGLPIIGNVFSLGTLPHLKMCEWQKQYGDTFTCYIGAKRIIVMHNFDTIRRVFAAESNAGRDQSSGNLQDITKGHGLIFSQGSLWRDHRRFAMSTLRDFGMGKCWLEDAIIAEVNVLCAIFEKHQCTPLDPKAALTHSVSNIISTMIFGTRFHHSSTKFGHMTSLVAELNDLFADNTVLQAFPILKHLPGPFRTRLRTFQQLTHKILKFIQELVNEHFTNFESDNIKDYIDAYVKHSKELNETGNLHSFSDFQLVVSVFDLFIAGTDTTSTTSLWALLFMLENPHVAKEVQMEIDNNVGRGRTIRMEDKGVLPYIEATLLEVQRCASLAPLSIVHQAMQDTEIDGYSVPKGTLLVMNTYSLDRDPRYWKSPAKFDPERFLDADRKIIRPNGFAPFSVGKRSCLGESLAKMELFLVFSNIMRRFDVRRPSGKIVTSDNCAGSSVVLAPAPFKVIFAPRD